MNNSVLTMAIRIAPRMLRGPSVPRLLTDPESIA